MKKNTASVRRKKKITVLFLDHSPKLGGATRVLLNLLQSPIKENIYPVVICSPSSGIIEDFRKLGVRVETIRMPWFMKKSNFITKLSYLYSLLYFSVYLQKLIKKYDAEIVHANGFIAALYAVLPSKLSGKALIWHMHDILEPGLFNKIFIRIAGGGAERIICVSEAVREELLAFGIAAMKCRVIYNYMPGSLPETGVKKRTFREEVGISEKTKLVGMIGNICELKGQSFFLASAVEILKKFPDTVFVIVGDIISKKDNIYKNELQQYIEKKELASNVMLTGFRKDIMRLTKAMDILVHPAVLPEAFGLVLLEAMDSEKPVVASNIGGIPEIVDDGVSGILVKPGDVQELVGAVCRLLEDPELCKRMGQEGKRILEEKFSAENHISGMNAVYQELLNS